MAQQFQPGAIGDTAGDLPALTGGNLEAAGVSHGFFMRTGGVSEGLYASLNCGRGSNDEKDRIEENRTRVAARLGAGSGNLIGPRQVHSARTVIATSAWKPGDAPEADAVATSVRGLAIGVLTADCAPILLADTQAGVIAAVHAGWKGAQAGVIESAIEAMEPPLCGSRPPSGRRSRRPPTRLAPNSKRPFYPPAAPMDSILRTLWAAGRISTCRPMSKTGYCAAVLPTFKISAPVPMKTNRFCSVTGARFIELSPIMGAKFPPFSSVDVDNWTGQA